MVTCVVVDNCAGCFGIKNTSPAGLKIKLGLLKAVNPECVVAGLGEVDCQNTINVLDVLQQLDITKVGLATKAAS